MTHNELIKQVIAQYPQLKGLKIAHCSGADKEHTESDRQYAHYNHKPKTICVARAFKELDEAYQLGILVHEVGHAMAIDVYDNEDHSEDDANHFGFEATGIPVEFHGDKHLEKAIFLNNPIKSIVDWVKKLFSKDNNYCCNPVYDYDMDMPDMPECGGCRSTEYSAMGSCESCNSECCDFCGSWNCNECSKKICQNDSCSVFCDTCQDRVFCSDCFKKQKQCSECNSKMCDKCFKEVKSNDRMRISLGSQICRNCEIQENMEQNPHIYPTTCESCGSTGHSFQNWCDSCNAGVCPKCYTRCRECHTMFCKLCIRKANDRVVEMGIKLGHPICPQCAMKENPTLRPKDEGEHTNWPPTPEVPQELLDAGLHLIQDFQPGRGRTATWLLANNEGKVMYKTKPWPNHNVWVKVERRNPQEGYLCNWCQNQPAAFAVLNADDETQPAIECCTEKCFKAYLEDYNERAEYGDQIDIEDAISSLRAKQSQEIENPGELVIIAANPDDRIAYPTGIDPNWPIIGPFGSLRHVRAFLEEYVRDGVITDPRAGMFKGRDADGSLVIKAKIRGIKAAAVAKPLRGETIFIQFNPNIINWPCEWVNDKWDCAPVPAKFQPGSDSPRIERARIEPPKPKWKNHWARCLICKDALLQKRDVFALCQLGFELFKNEQKTLVPVAETPKIEVTEDLPPPPPIPIPPSDDEIETVAPPPIPDPIQTESRELTTTRHTKLLEYDTRRKRSNDEKAQYVIDRLEQGATMNDIAIELKEKSKFTLYKLLASRGFTPKEVGAKQRDELKKISQSRESIFADRLEAMGMRLQEFVDSMKFSRGEGKKYTQERVDAIIGLAQGIRSEEEGFYVDAAKVEAEKCIKEIQNKIPRRGPDLQEIWNEFEEWLRYYNN